MKVYSENIIFIDTEFTNLDIRVGELLSVGLVKYSGEELYMEFEYNNEANVDPWVKEKVLPSLTGEKISQKNAQEILQKFIGDDRPFMMAYVNQFDAIYWYQLFGSPKEHPLYWIPLDFASVLFAHGYSPNSMGQDKFFSDLEIDKTKYNSHNALEDARLLSETYKKFVEKNNLS